MLAAFAMLAGLSGDIRVEFRAKLDLLKADMSAEQVRAILGAPDTVIQPSGKYVFEGTTWYYGVKSGSPAPTLGKLYFVDNVLKSWQGTRGVRFMPEGELTKLIQHCAMPRYFEPLDRQVDVLTLIRTANALRPLGKEKAILALRELDSIGAVRDAHWITLTLFQPRRGKAVPLPRLGGYASPDNPLDVPTFPIVIEDGIPFCSFTGADLAGVPEDFESYIKRVSAELVLREDKLVPGNPFLAAERCIARLKLIGFELREHLQYQAIWMSRTAIPGVRENKSSYADPDEFEEKRRAFIELGARWDSDLGMFAAPGKKPFAIWSDW